MLYVYSEHGKNPQYILVYNKFIFTYYSVCLHGGRGKMKSIDLVLYTALTLSLMFFAVAVGYFIGDSSPSGNTITPLPEPIELIVEVIKQPIYYIEQAIDTTELDYWEKEDLKETLGIEWFDDLPDRIDTVIPVYPPSEDE